MTVTGIETAGKGKYQVYLEGQLAFVLYGSELSRYQIEENAELSDETYDRILKEVLLKRAQARSLYLLKSMDRTEYQIRQKLKEGNYPEPIIEEVIRWLYGFHYLDDRRYTENYISLKKDSRSRRQIILDLTNRGIPKELAEEVFEAESMEDETALIRKWMEKKKIDPDTAEPKEIQKFYQFLIRKGFRASDIAKVLRW
ncbi:MAG: RecX family transcriptional regulator [Eubacteriales bacterium]|nr:RecX family transcriptional regulator [Eubacteriales bacterium]